MPYQTVQINLVGGSNPNRTRAISQERTLNMYPEPVPSGAYPSVLLPWPGCKTFSDGTGSGTPRGIYTHERTGLVYKVVDTTLYSMDLNGVETSVGTVTGTGLVLFESLYDSIGTIGTKLLITSNTNGYVYDIDAATLTTVTDPSYFAGGSVVAVSGFVIWQVDKNQYAVADVGTPTSIQAENISTVSSFADDIVQIARFRETIYMMGSVSVEPYYIGSTGTNPLTPIQSGTAKRGLIARGCVDSNENALYWVGDDKVLYMTNAYDPQSVTTPSIANKFASYDFTGARVICLKVDNQNFVLVLTDSASWCYSETTNQWFELAYKADEEIYVGYDVTYGYNRNLVQSKIDGKVFELDLSTYQDNAQTTIRERVTAPINASALGKNGGRLMMKRAEIIMESGVGNLDEVNPLVMVSTSVDGGQSFSNEQWIRAGRDGENRLRVEYYQMLSFRQVQFKIRTSDPNFFNFHSMAVDIKMAGNF
jgi:hypothetical protein